MKAAQDLRRGRTVYPDIVEHSLDCVCVHDVEGVILSANPAFVRAVDARSDADLIDSNVADLLPPAVRHEFPRYLRTLAENGRAEGTMRVLTGRGETRIFQYRNVLQQTANGVVVYGTARDVTEAERARKRLAESEMRFRQLFERNVAVVMITTFDGRFVDANDETLRLVGAPSREAFMKTLASDYYVHPEARTLMVNTVQRTGTMTRRELCIRRFDGTYTWIVASSALVDFGAPHGQVILTTAVDISDQKKLEERIAGQLRDSEHDYQALFTHSHDPILVLEPYTERVREVNDAGCQAYRLPRERLIGRSMHEFSRAGQPDRSREIFEAEGGFVNFDTVQVREDGTLMEMEISAGTIVYRDSPAILSINRDVTEKRRIEQERQQAYARVSTVARQWTATFDAVPNPVIVASAARRIQRANRAAIALLRCEPHEVAGRSLDDLPGEPWFSIGALCRSGIDISVEVTENERIWDISMTTLRDEDAPENRYIIILRDVTATHQLQKSLLQVETMSAMGSLVAGVLHEVRNPLFSILATVDALETRAGDSAPAKYIQRLRADVGRLRKVMSDLLEYGRPYTLEVQEGLLFLLLASASAACATTAEELQVMVEIDPSPLCVRGDSERLRQVFQNLIENAVQHSPRGGKVVVHARREPWRGNQCVIVDVEDQGPGFAKADLPQVFEPFFTRRRGGTGLGLSIVRKIVEEHGGLVQASNLPGGGGRVSVFLPD